MALGPIPSLRTSRALELDPPTERLGGRPVTFATGRLEEARATGTAVATTFKQARPLVGPGRLRRGAEAVSDLLTAVAIVLCIPFVILAIGTPIALGVRLLLWIGELI